MKILLQLLIIFFIEKSKASLSDEENAMLPRLFYLDDQDRCLARKDGLYCLGEFDLGPIGPSATYKIIEKYSENLTTFNRSRLYRGYCVSERCPHPTNSTQIQVNQLFEKCVQQRARRYALTARLRTLKYCTTHEQHRQKMAQPPDAAQTLFMQVVYALLILNLVGTVYDAVTDDGTKNSLIAAWSVRMSWRRLTAVYDNGDPRIKELYPLQGMRVIITLMTINSHTWVQQYQIYVTNPQKLEEQYWHVNGIFLANGTAISQLYVMISCFLTAYNLLIYSEKHKLSWFMLPLLILKRFIRIAPTHLLLVGFAATYWPSMCSGPHSALIEEYAASCRRKFWTHVFFLNNVVDKEDICLIPSWSLPVDMHLFIVSCVLTILMSRRRHFAMRFYIVMFVLSSIFCGAVGYVTGWQTIFYITTPENLRGFFRESPSFSGFYTSSWGSLPSCFVGLFLAHLHYDLQEQKYNWRENLWFIRLRYFFIPAQLALVYYMGVTLRQYTQRWVTALCLAIDRPLFSCFFLVLIISIINYRGGLVRLILLWRFWRVPARLSLPMILCHWIFSVAITARPVAYHISAFDVCVDFVAVAIFGYATSAAVALLVEIPVQNFFNQIF